MFKVRFAVESNSKTDFCDDEPISLFLHHGGFALSSSIFLCKLALRSSPTKLNFVGKWKCEKHI